jgi:hypothetical protein
MPAGRRLEGVCVASLVIGGSGARIVLWIGFRMLDCRVFGRVRLRGAGCLLRFG